MNILILGHKGLLGQDLLWRFRHGHEVVGKDREDFDIASASDCDSLLAEFNPRVVINATGYTDGDRCEVDEARCFAVNACGVKNIAQSCRKKDATLVHFSDASVFDGKKGKPYEEENECNPVNAYGRSKLEGESYLKEGGADYLLVRTSWLYGRGGDNFVKNIAEKAKNEKILNVADDLIGSPTYAADLAAAVLLLLESGQRGVFHVTNRGICSRYELARKIVQYSLAGDVEVRAAKSATLPGPAKQPAYSVLGCKKFTSATGRTMPYWQIALQDYMDKMNFNIPLQGEAP